jgi:hypothetical protein
MSTTYAGDFPQITTSTYGTMMAGASHLVPHDEGIIVPATAWEPELPEPTEPTMPANMSRRIVQVFIADPDINVPLESALLYKSEPKFTDATDQELYFEVPIVDLLSTHNAKRKTWLDKDASRKAGKDVFLDAAKIRDLKMVVVNIAQF